MEVNCPNCTAPMQEAGKYCENCGYFIPADAGQAGSGPSSVVPDPGAPTVAPTPGVPTQLDTAAAPASTPPVAPAPPSVGAQFAVVQNGLANLNEGFTISRVGEFLVGRMDQETGHQVDVDLRQWVQPIDVGGQKQYLIHRKQCYIGLTADDVVTLRSAPGYEADTLVKGPGDSTFTSLQNLGSIRPARPDGSFELQLNDQIFMGDPDTVMYYLSGDPTAQGNYIVIELISKS